MHEFWSYLLVGVGLVGFVLAGKKVWWAWYVNFFCQFLWLAYAVLTEQWGFIVGALVYSVVFMRNAIKWTDEERQKKKLPRAKDYPDGTIIIGTEVYLPGTPLPWLPQEKPASFRAIEDADHQRGYELRGEFKAPLKPPPTLSPENIARLQELNRQRLKGL